ncbi:MAG TPA: Gfo/Idh/MocA family oxidoreductase, partial [Spirochaetia bacterium]|nr:Gfo/Idh/MocA family oxidoreductase [Spirochaetia bacterium]
MSESLRVGIIGLGRAGEKHARAFSRIPGVTVGALCDASRERLGPLTASLGARAYTDYRELLADPNVDAVSIV